LTIDGHSDDHACADVAVTVPSGPRGGEDTGIESPLCSSDTTDTVNSIEGSRSQLNDLAVNDLLSRVVV
jgi:hypothetical protein